MAAEWRDGRQRSHRLNRVIWSWTDDEEWQYAAIVKMERQLVTVER
jgi:hypothetical protein